MIGECIYLDRDNRLIIFLSQNKSQFILSSNELKKVSRVLAKMLDDQYTNIEFYIGVGRLRKSIIEASESYQEAISALRLRSLVCHDEKVVHFEDLAIYKLLFDHRLEQKFIAFEDDIFGALYQLKKDNRSLLLSTLQTYFKHQCNIHDTAKALLVHPNTLRYRLHKIEKLCHIDLGNSEHMLRLQIALKIAELNNRL